MSYLDEKRRRDTAVLSAIHPGIFDDVEPEQTATPDFDAGTRGDDVRRRVHLPVARGEES